MDKKIDSNAEILDKIVQYRFSDPEYVLKTSKDLYEKSMQTKDYYYASIAKFYEGDAYLSLNKVHDACAPILEAIQLQKTHRFHDYIGKCLNLLGIVFYSQGDYTLAFKYYLDALEFAIDTKDILIQSYIYNNIAAIFLLYGDARRAQPFFIQAKNARMRCVKDKNVDPISLTRININLGIYQVVAGKYDKAKEILDEIMANITDKEIEAINLFIWEFAGSVMKHLGEEDKATGFYLKLAQEAEKYCDFDTFNVTFGCMHYLVEKGYTTEAKKLLEITDAVAQKLDSCVNQLYVLNEWIYYYKTIKDYDSLQACYLKYYELVQKNKELDDKNQLIALENRTLLTAMINEKKSLLKKNTQYEKISTIDSLTGLLNRNGMKHLVDELLVNNKKNRRNINLAIIDIDHFKSFNDQYGHLIGDNCLKSIANVIKTYETDQIKGIRFGGDEFFVIGDGISTSEWENKMQQIHHSCHKMSTNYDETESFTITTSIGIYSQIPDEETSFRDYIHYADIALYQVKQDGRNNYHTYTES